MRALSRKKAVRKSLLRNIVTSLILFEKIKTTEAKAKEAKPIAEHLINEARQNDVNARRKLLAYLFDENAVNKVLEVLVPRYKNVKSGFIKSYRLGNRLGDGAQEMILQLAQIENKEEKEGSDATITNKVETDAGEKQKKPSRAKASTTTKNK